MADTDMTPLNDTMTGDVEGLDAGMVSGGGGDTDEM
jgi:hypothetical protein